MVLAVSSECAVRSVTTTTAAAASAATTAAAVAAAASAASADLGILMPFHCAPNNKG